MAEATAMAKPAEPAEGKACLQFSAVLREDSDSVASFRSALSVVAWVVRASGTRT